MFMTAPAMWVLKRLGLRGKLALVSVLGLGSMAGAGWAVQALPTLPALGGGAGRRGAFFVCALGFSSGADAATGAVVPGHGPSHGGRLDGAGRGPGAR